MTSPNPPQPGAISLNPAEARFCDLLNAFAQTLDPPVECRIAGGWVRDKLLDLPSNDLDIALPLSSGYSFTLGFTQYIRNHTPRDGDAAVSVGSVGKVAANPQQSKHLETGTTRVMGLECDFVGLRSERYTDSRIPDEVKLGTPLEDALRRDLTINALFYNVATRAVEDHTERGLADLAERVARTPLPPKQTFFDDPLRVLRAIRFAGRFQLRVEDELAEAARDPEVQAALRTKVSKERIGIEITKTLAKSPLQSIELIHDLGLHSSIFTCPTMEGDEADAMDTTVSLRTARILGEVLRRWEWDVPGVEHLWLAAALSPFEGRMATVGKKEVSAVSGCISEGLKLSTEQNRGAANPFIAQTLLDPDATGRSQIGIALQNQAVRPWRRSVAWAAVAGMRRVLDAAGRGGGSEAGALTWTEAAEAELERWKVFVRRVEELGLEEEIDAAPLLDGKSALALLELKPSPVLQIILHAARVWQFDHPGASREECAAWVKERWADEEQRGEWERAAPVLVVKGKEKRKR